MGVQNNATVSRDPVVLTANQRQEKGAGRGDKLTGHRNAVIESYRKEIIS